MTVISIVFFLIAVLSYIFIDLPFANLFYSYRNYPVNYIFEAITFFGRSELYLIPTAGFFIFFRKTRKKSAQKFLFMFSAVAVSGILADIIKVIAGRYRPVLYFNRGWFGFDFFHIDSDYLSFPSGHAATSMSIMVALGILFPKFRLVYYLIGAIIASSRAVITAHYLSDVIFGGLIGVLTSVWLYNRFYKKRFADSNSPTE